VTAADWNSDGVPDLLYTAEWDQGILLALGPFKDNQPIPCSEKIELKPEGFVADFAVADWDGDGKPDLLVHKSLPGDVGGWGIYWYKNLGGPGVPKLAEGKLLVDFGSDRAAGFCVCDWNGDGRPDLVVTRTESVPVNREGTSWRQHGTVWLYLRE